MLPYIETILSWNPKVNKKNKGKKKGKKKTDNKKDTEEKKSANKKPMRRWGIMILDPQGQDANNNKYSIIKIHDKWLNKRIPSVGLFGMQNLGAKHERRGSDESITSAISASPGSGPRIKVEIKNLYFIGGLHNGELISHLLHRRGQSLATVIKGCIFLGSDDPYDANDVTKSIYTKCGINYLNSNLPIDSLVEGKKVNGDPYIIRRISSGNPRYCCQSSFSSIIKFIKISVDKKEEEINEEDQDEYKKD
eukprot:53416_1